MGKTIASILLTLDGFMSDPTDNTIWTSELEQEANSHLHDMGLILLDETTYKVMSVYWPNATPDMEDPVVLDYMNKTPKIVLSPTLTEVAWGAYDNATVMNEDTLIKELSERKARSHESIVVLNSPRTVQLLTRHGLIDEYKLLLQPVILGEGVAVWEDIQGKIALRLTHSQSFSNGTIALYYRNDKENHEQKAGAIYPRWR
jgi:dihydrofolate reductase